MIETLAWVLVGLLVVIAFLMAMLWAAPWINRPFWRLVLGPRYKRLVFGLEHLPAQGPGLVISNHVTWIDGFLLVASCPRSIHFLINADITNAFALTRWIASRTGMIPVPSTGPRAQRAAIEIARAALDTGQLVGIFPEAQLSRNGRMNTFHRGLELILKNREQIPVIPVVLGNLWGSNFSFSDGRCLRKRPEGLRRTVVVVFGPPISPPVTAVSARQAVLELSARAQALCPPDSRSRRLPDCDLNLPHWIHDSLGLLAHSAPDYDRNGIKQDGLRLGSVGQAALGVALRVSDGEDQPGIVGGIGRIEAFLGERPEWIDTNRVGRIDRDGFVFLDEPIA